MLSIKTAIACCAVLLAILPGAEARDASADREIGFLLHQVEDSGARFIRNGTEYSPKEAADHLREKLSSAGARVKTADDFIEGVASKSYLSGKPYQMKLPDGTIQPAGPWLSAVLARHRAAAK